MLERVLRRRRRPRKQLRRVVGVRIVGVRIIGVRWFDGDSWFDGDDRFDGRGGLDGDDRLIALSGTVTAPVG